MATQFQRIPIVEAARRCGLAIDDRTIRRTEVEASCPFCGDHGPGKHHLSMNTDMDVFRCNLCAASGNSVTLYARLKGVSNKEAYRDLTGTGGIYPPVSRSVSQYAPPYMERQPERQPAPLPERHAVYSDMLSCLTLYDAHRRNLRKRGLDDERIARNGYKSMPEAWEERRRIAEFLSRRHNLTGIPGFYTRYGAWTMAGPCGTLIPVRNMDGLIQGLKIRLDDEANPGRKYRWFSSRDRHMENGTRSYSWIHVTGDRTRKRAFLTEGPLKGDVASFLAKDALFICTGGVNAARGLRETIEALGVTEVVEAMDMDQTTNPQVLRAVLAMRQEVMTIPGIRYSRYAWNPQYKGVDDYFLYRVSAMKS